MLMMSLLQILFEDDSILDLKRNMIYSVKEQIPRHVRAKLVSIFESRRRANSSSKLQETSTLWLRKYPSEVSFLFVSVCVVLCVRYVLSYPRTLRFPPKRQSRFFLCSRTPPTWFIASTCTTWNGRCRPNGPSSINLPQNPPTMF